MKNVHPIKVFTALIATILLLTALLFVPNNDFLFDLPSLTDVVRPENEQVTTYYGLEHNETFLPVENRFEEDSGKVGEFFRIPEQNKITHADDFENDLSSFYRKLNSINTSDKTLRILHIGDSQIEGDRITGQLRSYFQKKFGGSGTGYMPISDHKVYRLNVGKKVGGFKRFKVFGNTATGHHNRYGFTGYYHTVKPDLLGTILMTKKKKYFENCYKGDQVSVLFEGKSPENITLKIGQKERTNFTLEENGTVKLANFKLDSVIDKPMKLSFKADTNTNFYGLAFESNKGVVVDNVGLRGSSGIEFTKMDEEKLKAQLELLNTSLIIYQFGVNVVPFITEDYQFYENMVYKQLKLFKRIAPDIAIIVVGVSDMCQKVDGEFVSYPNIPTIKAAQKRAAKRAGCSFWDLEQVMGGKNAMRTWVSAEPALAEKDYTHFNVRGANLVGEELFNAIMYDFQSNANMGFN